ncbi:MULTISPECIES: single-stranded DNA-binding protein [Paenibacillus]|uniref:Single-stranded DNA-binding protein n=1 Tax=Paenibacillus pabuli TaxID=1472 RepID=A0A855Y4W6_9BACL|nr:MULTISPECIES: single-stranded DNA-binding protein [Paenibacillus]PWW37348.1 single-strand DNA-binding protein [Paenibacillus pabuli]PXW05490.1 single-strand DNA-binding protein [Paenibacillus taichungensis]
MLNRSVLIGRLTRDPELRYSPTGVAVTQFTLAVDRPFTSQGGEREADFIPIVVWRQQAEACANYLRKGRLCAVEGRIQVRNYENNAGTRVYVTEVIADNVRFLESANNNRRSPEEEPDEPRRQNNNRDPFAEDGKPIDISDDDLPF